MNVFLEKLLARFETLEAELNALDAATGDGDHGTTILKGLRAAVAAPNNAGAAFRTAAGGASGSLFGQVLSALLQASVGSIELSAALSQAANRISQVGNAKAGDKTMLDALLPASLESTARAAAVAARKGAEATRAMAAKRGRARQVEGKGVGHLDAGAVSVATVLEVYADTYGDSN